MYRDFTYIDDVIDAVVKLQKKINKILIYSILEEEPIKVNKFLEYIRENLNKKLIIQNVMKPKSDMSYTYSDKQTCIYLNLTKISLKDGVKKYVDWFKKYYLWRIKVKFGIIGLGRVVEKRVASVFLKEVKNAKVVAVYDIDRKKFKIY